MPLSWLAKAEPTPGHRDRKSALALHPGEVLFSGDRINTGDPVRTTVLALPFGKGDRLAERLIGRNYKGRHQNPGFGTHFIP